MWEVVGYILVGLFCLAVAVFLAKAIIQEDEEEEIEDPGCIPAHWPQCTVGSRPYDYAHRDFIPIV